MKNTTLVFPDTVRMAHFVLSYCISGAEVNTRKLSLSAYLSRDQIAIACCLYDACPRAEVLDFGT